MVVTVMGVAVPIAPISIIAVATRLIRDIWDEVAMMPKTEVTAVVTKTVTTAKSMATAKAVTKTMSTAKPVTKTMSTAKPMSATMSSMRTCQRNTRLQGECSKNGDCEQ